MRSDSFSLEGWSFLGWVKGNWKTIKEVGKVVVPYVLASSYVEAYNLQAVLTILGKAILDVCEYYVKEYD